MVNTTSSSSSSTPAVADKPNYRDASDNTPDVQGITRVLGGPMTGGDVEERPHSGSYVNANQSPQPQPTQPHSPSNWQCKRRLHHFLHPRTGGRSGRSCACGISTAPTAPATDWNLNAATFWPKVDQLVRNTIFALVPYLRVSHWAECCKSNGGNSSAANGKNTRTDRGPPQCFQVTFLALKI